MKKIPFVGLHAHSVAGSIFDAIGYPQEHMAFAYENGMDALASARKRSDLRAEDVVAALEQAYEAAGLSPNAP